MADSTLLDAKDAISHSRRQLTLPAWLALICIIAFSVLLWAGAVISKNAPPVPGVMRSPNQEILVTQANIQSGQEIYLSRGGQDIGSIWGHGSYLAPDWTPDVLHRLGYSTK
jgi:nitric oxide reductase subunit B